MLVDSFITSDAPKNSGESSGLRHIMLAAIDKAGAKWSELISTRTLPWYAQLKADNGAHAAFTGVRLIPATDPKKRSFFQKNVYRWEAVSVGDVCVFIVRGDELIHAFPIKNPGDFDNTPNLISSLHGAPDAHILIKSGEIRQGDTMFLLSDALAEWFLKGCEGGLFPWKTLGKIKNEAIFKLLIERLRQTKQMKNDDATAIILTIGKLP
ncbi:hypothetical protein [Candidatus Magnetominusculus xianensis]|uniref:PPM-type phosphatase domain-containing protein n=1 Tax=Candidatus Magnetominusculus xianensis TaxID=1748249 RepID=A0ABR5SMP5_9BACT|nr:hypothetical protein [Candidatus Magnetominusculus xianensis]KWT92910.1 hypothetical protein ASN18_0345 [Candidatus Magnetominusculus xianensis]MBF0402914.1 hypothetical protein [Nitrospirota bacterium]